MVDCYGKGIKYSLLIANSIIFLTGALILASGIWTISDRSLMERLLGINLYLASAILLIITGTIVVVIALLGTLGAYKELKYMLKAYFIILLGILTLILSIVSLCFIFRVELDDRIHKEMLSSMKLYGNDSHVTEAWDSMQINFECCGVTQRNNFGSAGRGFESWRRESSKFNNTDGPIIPESCCRSREDDQIKRACQGKQPKKEDSWFEGCYDKMKTIIKSHTITIALIVSFAMIFILFGLILSGTLYYIIGKKTTQKLTDNVIGETS